MHAECCARYHVPQVRARQWVRDWSYFVQLYCSLTPTDTRSSVVDLGGATAVMEAAIAHASSAEVRPDAGHFWLLLDRVLGSLGVGERLRSAKQPVAR